MYKFSHKPSATDIQSAYFIGEKCVCVSDKAENVEAFSADNEYIIVKYTHTHYAT